MHPTLSQLPAQRSPQLFPPEARAARSGQFAGFHTRVFTLQDVQELPDSLSRTEVSIIERLKIAERETRREDDQYSAMTRSDSSETLSSTLSVESDISVSSSEDLDLEEKKLRGFEAITPACQSGFHPV